MCGIAGYILDSPTLDLPSLAAQAQAMATAIAHRGPDDSGTWVDATAGIAFGHRRLSIIDLSVEGHQPMHSASGRYVIVYNGEIYNYADIRGELDGGDTPPRWRGHSDTETMLAAIERWGLEDALARFNGMFAFALWDRDTRTLHLARDRMGEKPLYYGTVGGRFAFGSELKALRALPGFAAEIDRDALALYLRHNYIPAPWSIYRGVRKLAPGARAEVRRLEGGAFDVRESLYWDLRAVARRSIATPATADDVAALGELERRLERSVGLRMVADVPIGAFLSGGVDSSIVVATMQRLASRPVKTFTIGFAEQAYDEAPFAKRVAAHLGTDHTEVYVSAADALGVVPNLPSMYDEPFADSSQIPTFLVSRVARSAVTVSLSGDGGDELFSGYERYGRGLELARASARAPSWMRRGAASALRSAKPATLDAAMRAFAPVLPRRLRFAHAGEKLHKLASVIGEDDPRALYLSLLSYWRDGLPLAQPSQAQTPHDAMRREDADLPLAQWMMLVDQCTYLPDDILAKVDRAAMAVSLETRVPLLDHDLVAYAWSIPLAQKQRDGRGKFLLRELLCRHVPRELVERPKRGFAIPLADWLRGPLKEWAGALLDPARIAREGFLDPARVDARWREHLAGTRNAQDELWGVLCFEAWLDANGAGA
ncbi:MAG: asparagine synthase (glutamine-hydrolyzing) [Betaproteobacteria bacterium]